MGGMGAGDVKLAAAIGVWIGPRQLFVALVMTALAGGVMAVAWAIQGKFLGELFKGSGDLLLGLGRRGKDAEQKPKLFQIRWRERCLMRPRLRLERFYRSFRDKNIESLLIDQLTKIGVDAEDEEDCER